MFIINVPFESISPYFFTLELPFISSFSTTIAFNSGITSTSAALESFAKSAWEPIPSYSIGNIVFPLISINPQRLSLLTGIQLSNNIYLLVTFSSSIVSYSPIWSYSW